MNAILSPFAAFGDGSPFVAASASEWIVDQETPSTRWRSRLRTAPYGQWALGSFPVLRLLVAFGVLLLGACAREGPLSLDSKVATRQANVLLRKGTPEARATKILQAKGFHVSRLNSDHATNHLLVGTCTKQNHTWLVGVVIVDGRVVVCSVTINEGS